jgi:hypothetical protein
MIFKTRELSDIIFDAFNEMFIFVNILANNSPTFAFFFKMHFIFLCFFVSVC